MSYWPPLIRGAEPPIAAGSPIGLTPCYGSYLLGRLTAPDGSLLTVSGGYASLRTTGGIHVASRSRGLSPGRVDVEREVAVARR